VKGLPVDGDIAWMVHLVATFCGSFVSNPRENGHNIFISDITKNPMKTYPHHRHNKNTN
jgi:hypothetical protein